LRVLTLQEMEETGKHWAPL